MTVLRKMTLSLLCLELAIAGCSRGDESTIESAPTSALPEAASEATSTENRTLIATETPANPAAAISPDLAEPNKTPAQIAVFTPPFPNRLELFEPPQRSQSAVRHDDELGETVELKGFIDVGQPQVVLSIDGQIASIPAGGEKFGVHVISIQPPTAVLQRGRTTWPATLE